MRGEICIQRVWSKEVPVIINSNGISIRANAVKNVTLLRKRVHSCSVGCVMTPITVIVWLTFFSNCFVLMLIFFFVVRFNHSNICVNQLRIGFVRLANFCQYLNAKLRLYCSSILSHLLTFLISFKL